MGVPKLSLNSKVYGLILVCTILSAFFIPVFAENETMTGGAPDVMVTTEPTVIPTAVEVTQVPTGIPTVPPTEVPTTAETTVVPTGIRLYSQLKYLRLRKLQLFQPGS